VKPALLEALRESHNESQMKAVQVGTLSVHQHLPLEAEGRSRRACPSAITELGPCSSFASFCPVPLAAF